MGPKDRKKVEVKPINETLGHRPTERVFLATHQHGILETAYKSNELRQIISNFHDDRTLKKVGRSLATMC